MYAILTRGKLYTLFTRRYALVTLKNPYIIRV
ncbi:hypothetical protein CPL00134L_CDS0075 [Escherichia phage Phagiculus]